MALDTSSLWARHKPKWRTRAGGGLFHCFVGVGHDAHGHITGYGSLCGIPWPKSRWIGAHCDRPMAGFRCARCDQAEIRLGEAAESYQPSRRRSSEN